MPRRIIVLLAIAAMVVAGASAQAQEPAPAKQPSATPASPVQQPAPVREPPPPQDQPAAPDPVRSMLGPWEFSNADRDRRCNVVIKDEKATVGMKVEFDAACVIIFPFLKDVVGWKVASNGFVLFIDAEGKTILDFSEVETGLLETLREGEGVLFLQTAAEVGPPPKTAAEMAGEWAIVRGDKPICALTLANKALGPEALALTVKPGCDALVTRFAPVAWQMDRGELVLHAAHGETWRFEAADAKDGKTWQRVTERPDGITMVRQ
jgi:Protease inhibitor Inh